MQVTSSIRETLITGGKTMRDVSEDISRQVEGKPSQLWWTAMSIAKFFRYYFYIHYNVTFQYNFN